MLYYAALCFVIALAALIIGFFSTLLVGAVVYFAKICFFIFSGLFFVFFIIDFTMKRRGKKTR